MTRHLETDVKSLGRPWALGVVLVAAFAVFGELLLVFDDYVFHRLGLNRNALLLALWALPFIAAYVAARYSETHKLLAGLSFLILFPVIGTAAHYLNGALGGTVDFAGLSGAAVTFRLYLALGSVLVITGTLLGLLFSKQS